MLLNGDEIKRRRAARGVLERSLRDALGPYRRLLSGNNEATLLQTETIADLLGCTTEAISLQRQEHHRGHPPRRVFGQIPRILALAAANSSAVRTPCA